MTPHPFESFAERARDATRSAGAGPNIDPALGLTLAVGLVLGLAFGTLWVLLGFGAAVGVLCCGLAGTAIAGAVYGTLTGSLDPRGALRVLLRRDGGARDHR